MLLLLPLLISPISSSNAFIISSSSHHHKMPHPYPSGDSNTNAVQKLKQGTFPSIKASSAAAPTATALFGKKPQRLEENTSGPLYVNNDCINCGACSNFAPTVFSRSPSDQYHIVHKQPDTTHPIELQEARAALSACPVSAIRVTTSAELNHAHKGMRLSEEEEVLAKSMAINQKVNGLVHPFPRHLFEEESNEMEVPNVHYLGHHNSASFGATPYLARGRSSSGKMISVMVDTPKYSESAVRTVTSLLEGDDSGPDYLFLSHTDDVGDHYKWAERFPNIKRIFHMKELKENNWIGDATLEDVEVILEGETNQNSDGELKLQAWNLDGEAVDLLDNNDSSAHTSHWPVKKDDEEKVGDFLILHTPGHSVGSISLLFRSTSQKDSSSSINVLFTGDTYAYTTRNGGHMSGFPRYTDNSAQQSRTLSELLNFSYCWDLIAPGHGEPRDYRLHKNGKEDIEEAKRFDMEIALKDLLLNGRI